MQTPPAIIPRPVAERWRDARLRHVPVAVYLIAVLMVIYLWDTQWMPASFVGEVQANTANVASPLAGQLTDMSVLQFDRVTRGQTLGRVNALTPAAIDAGVAAIRADLQIMRARMSTDRERNHMDYQQVRIDQLDQKVSLAVAKSKLHFAENELQRFQQLRTNLIASQSEFELAQDTRDALAAETREREELVAQMDLALATMKSAGTPEGEASMLGAIDTAIEAQQKKFRLTEETVLQAPIDGVVTRVGRNSGENITAGEPLISISSDRPESILGFIRQPISFEPKPGDTIVVRSRRGHGLRVGQSRVLKVGAQLELFTQPLRVRGLGNAQERGLPVLISLPQGIALYPGELVDLALKN